MAEIYSTVSGQGQEAKKVQARTESHDPVAGEDPVAVYERPPRSTTGIASLFLLLLVLVILAYFLFQWWS